MKQSLGILLGVGVLVAFAFSSCSKPPKEMSGQVFIVTRGRQSIKMALVEVRLYDLRVVENWLREIAPRVASYQKRAEELVEDTRSSATTASIYSKSLLDKFRVEDQDLIRTAANRADKATELERAAEAYLQVARSGIPYFTELPKEPTAFTKTDADGHFSFDLPGKSQRAYALIASAERETPNGAECYFWAIRVPPDQAPLKISLSNDNLTSTSAKGSLIHTLDLALDLKSAIAIKENGDELRRQLREIDMNVPTPKPARERVSTPTPGPAPILPEFSPPPPPEFVRLTQDFALLNANGKEVRRLSAGKRLRVISRNKDGVTISSYGEPFLIPANITEPSK